jgi:hypothetical protein
MEQAKAVGFGDYALDLTVSNVVHPLAVYRKHLAVIQPDSSEARNTTAFAISSGFRSGPSWLMRQGVVAPSAAPRPRCVISVRTKPGPNARRRIDDATNKSANVALWVRLDAKPAKEAEVEQFLRGGFDIVQQEFATVIGMRCGLGLRLSEFSIRSPMTADDKLT